MSAQASGASATLPNFLSAAKVLRVHSVPLPRSVTKGLNRTPVLTPLWYCTSDWPPAGRCAADHNPLSPAVQPVSVHLTVHLSSLYFISLSVWMLWEDCLNPC